MPAIPAAMIYVPFLVVFAGLAIWAVASLLRHTKRRLREARVDGLIRENRLEEAVQFLRERGESARAGALLTQYGFHAEAAGVLEETGLFAEAGQAAMKAGLMLRAAELFQRGKDFPSAAGCYLSAGRPKEAVDLLRQAGDIGIAARLMERKGEHELAIQLYMEVGDLERVAASALDHVSDKRFLRQVAEYLEGRGEKQLALGILKKGHFMLEVGRLLEQMGRPKEAIAAYQSHDYFGEAAGVLSRLGLHREAASNYLKGGQVEEALKELLAGDEFLACARLYARTGRPAEAIQALDRVVAGTPYFRAARLMACSLYVEHRRFRDAARELRILLDVVGHTTDNIELVYRLVDLQLQLGEVEQAIASLERAKRAGVCDPRLDEQLMVLRQSPESLLEPSAEEARTVPAHAGSRVRKTQTTVGFPRSERYTLRRKLARGGHGILYLVEDRKLSKDVVLKLLNSETLPSDLARRYFLREAKTAAALDHPNIVRVFDYGELEGRPYIAMEFVDGLNLIELQETNRGQLPRDRLISICIQLSQALAYAHGKTVIHRDIKLENVMVTTYWQVKLMDFGLAKALDENPDRSLFIIGTPFYMSPEQIIGDKVDHRTDIYSLGVVMFRLFAGRLPFEEGEILSHHRFTPPPDPRTIAPDLPAELAETILTCLKKKREERYDSANAIAERLRRLQE